MVKTLENFVTTEEIKWFRNDMAAFFESNDYTELRDDSTNIFDKFGIENWFIRDYRRALNKSDVGFQLAKQLMHNACPELSEDINVYIAYVRQYIPQAHHVDVHTDINKESYTILMPLDENVNGIFKTIVWDKECLTQADFNEFRWDFIDHEEKYPKVGNVTELYDVEHCATGRNLSDYIPFEGVYEYKLGTAGIFKRTHIHASSNWYKYKLFDHKDFIIFHTFGK